MAGLGVSTLVALAMEANDLANSIAPIVVSKILSFKYALLLFFIFRRSSTGIYGYENYW